MPITASHELTPETNIGRPGRIVFLNGTSSSGKSSIAKELLGSLDGTWFHLAIDQFHRIRARREMPDDAFLPVFQRTVLGFHRAVAGMASAGNDVVVESDRHTPAECAALIRDRLDAGPPTAFDQLRARGASTAGDAPDVQPAR